MFLFFRKPVRVFSKTSSVMFVITGILFHTHLRIKTISRLSHRFSRCSTGWHFLRLAPSP